MAYTIETIKKRKFAKIPTKELFRKDLTDAEFRTLVAMWMLHRKNSLRPLEDDVCEITGHQWLQTYNEIGVVCGFQTHEQSIEALRAEGWEVDE